MGRSSKDRREGTVSMLQGQNGGVSSSPRDGVASSYKGQDPDALDNLISWFNDKTQATSRSWLGGSENVKTPMKHEQSYRKAKKRVVEAVSSVLGPTVDLAHQALFVGVDLLQFAPVPALDIAGKVLLNIWDAVETIEINRLSCLRLTERCAEMLLAIRAEVDLAGVGVADELREPVERLHTAFEEIRTCLQKQIHRPFYYRYIKREEIQRDISNCDTLLSDALDLFGIRVQIRTLKLVQANSGSHQQSAGLVEHTWPVDEKQPIPFVPLPQYVDEPSDPVEIRKRLSIYRESQNLRDLARDMADLRQLMHDALDKNDDVAMLEVLQVGRKEMPEAIALLQRALEQETLSGSSPSRRLRSLPDALGEETADTLDREFIRNSIKALKRLSHANDIDESSWTTSGDDSDEDSDNEWPFQAPRPDVQGSCVQPEHAQARSLPNALVVTRDESGSAANADPEDYRAALDDPAWKVLPATLGKYKMANKGEDWRNYAMFICYGTRDNRVERCISHDEKPLLIFQELKDAHQNPAFLLRHMENIHSAATLAQLKGTVADVDPTSSSVAVHASA